MSGVILAWHKHACLEDRPIRWARPGLNEHVSTHGPVLAHGSREVGESVRYQEECVCVCVFCVGLYAGWVLCVVLVLGNLALAVQALRARHTGGSGGLNESTNKPAFSEVRASHGNTASAGRVLTHIL